MATKDLKNTQQAAEASDNESISTVKRLEEDPYIYDDGPKLEDIGEISNEEEPMEKPKRKSCSQRPIRFYFKSNTILQEDLI